MKVAFRVDASIQIGTGHVMRCLTLARALRDAGAACHFILRSFPGDMEARVAAEGFATTCLSAPTGPVPEGPPDHADWAGVEWQDDARETRTILEELRPDWLILDHYAFDARWQRAARPEGTRLMVLDDLADRPHDCDLLLDQNLGRKPTDYDGFVPESCLRLIGPHYAVLRPEFADLRAESLLARAGRGVRHLLISMGGVDADDATSAILLALRAASLPEGLRITVVMGSHAPALDHVRVVARSMPCPTEVAVDINDMGARMAQADLAIGAAGATTWERCALGLPAIIVQIADNQAGIARALSDAGAALDPGPVNAPEFAQNLQTALTKARPRLGAMSERAAYICDGDGAARVVAALQMERLA
ncbi:UDP-2,4-diacetamido-2,4,6-trideoxy-beta-L-altropyranose hydrolase [Roseinatronobacter sp.]|uniref:UDP-2,4-diacetamido-2,4, 6-trideoxy-beta-L-altropyranose hydrolase n=1 Tax=Roseinatronobacter sp. TaxID=1945755 RepID=UPI0025F94C05|nr:UDP-2,4-diacetamido-2,4,6-trideoxy-beta-L-altropyranose hydrolase [Roseibaca sp.]